MGDLIEHISKLRRVRLVRLRHDGRYPRGWIAAAEDLLSSVFY